MNFKALSVDTEYTIKTSLCILIFILTTVLGFTFNNYVPLLVLVIIGSIPIYKNAEPFDLSPILPTLVICILVFMFCIRLVDELPGSNVWIQLENQQVEQINTTERDSDGTWYKITSDNYPDMFVRDRRDIVTSGKYYPGLTITTIHDVESIMIQEKENNNGI